MTKETFETKLDEEIKTRKQQRKTVPRFSQETIDAIKRCLVDAIVSTQSDSHKIGLLRAYQETISIYPDPKLNGIAPIPRE